MERKNASRPHPSRFIPEGCLKRLILRPPMPISHKKCPILKYLTVIFCLVYYLPVYSGLFGLSIIIPKYIDRQQTTFLYLASNEEGSRRCGGTMEDRWLSVEEIASYLGIKRDTVYRWINEKQMPAYRMGRLWKFKKDEVDKWVKAGGAAENTQKGPGK